MSEPNHGKGGHASISAVLAEYSQAVMKTLDSITLIGYLYSHADHEVTMAQAQAPEETRDYAALIYKRTPDPSRVLTRAAVVFVWAEVEAFVVEFLAAWLLQFPATFSLPPFEKLKIEEPVSKWARMSQKEQAEAYADSLLKKHSRARREGEGGEAGRVKAFFDILECFGVPGGGTAEEKKLVRDLIEFQQVRNTIIHRKGVVDAKLLETCPWMGMNYALGDPLVCNIDMLKRHVVTAVALAIELRRRVDEHERSHRIDEQ